jgi:hypothetical protein
MKKTNTIPTFATQWTYRARIGEDTLPASLQYADDFQGWASRCPLLGSPHPDLPGFLLIEIEASRRDGGDLIDVTLNYEASAATAEYPGRQEIDEPTARYSVRVAGAEEHILTSPYAAPLDAGELRALYNISNGQDAQEDGTPWQDEVASVLGLSLLEKIRRGNTAYKTGQLAYVERTQVTTLSAINYNLIGKINLPPGPVSGLAKNWLYETANAEPTADGLAWTLERVWLYSPEGWDQDLYT